MTKSEQRHARQAAHAARVSARLEAGDTRSARERQQDRAMMRPKRRRRGAQRPTWGSQEWAETRGDDLPSLDQPGDDFDTDGGR